MVPRLIRSRLSSLRWRERGLRLIWRSVLWLLLVVLAVAMAFAVDWTVDLREDVPGWLRTGLVVWELSMAVLAVLALIFWPWSRQLGDDALALFVEDREPHLGHRLISTVQLNREGADTRGMSPVLIERLTKDTEKTVRPMSFARLADHRRLKWSLLVLVPLGLAVAGVYLLWPDTVMALVNRQLGGDDLIPRRVQIHSVAFDRKRNLFEVTEGVPLIEPLNDDVVLRFAATGMWSPERARGDVKVTLEDGRVLYYPLALEREMEGGWALYSAKVPQPPLDFTYRAWLDDGRTRMVSSVHMEPRPTVTELDAVVTMPSGYQLELGVPKSRPMKDGDVVSLLGGTADIRVAVQPGKHLETATLELLEKPMPRVLPMLRGGFGLSPVPLGLAADVVGQCAAEYVAANVELPESAARKDLGPEFVLPGGRMAMTIGPEPNVATAAFAVTPEMTGYRIRVTDQYGFDNADVPRRSVRIVEDAVPVVEFLPERLGSTYAKAKRPEAVFDDTLAVVNDAENPDRTIRLAFRCNDDYGLKRAQLRYRHVPRGNELAGRIEQVDPVYIVTPGLALTANPSVGSPLGHLAETVVGLGVIQSQSLKAPAADWIPLPLVEYVRPREGEDVGNFDLEMGVFEFVKDFKTAQINFHRVPGEEGYLDGGGRFDFHINVVENLKAGDTLEFFIEVFDNHPDTARNLRQPGKSELRVKTVVTEPEFQVALRAREEQERKLRDLEKKQTEVFTTPRKP